MAMMQPPPTPSRPSQQRSWLKDEWDHWGSMPPLRFCLLALPNLVLFAIDPLLPLAAFLLQLWASSSWNWRARWASIEDWAKQGARSVAALVALAVLTAWFFPGALALLQHTWSEHLPGVLDLSPLDSRDLLARSLLLLPLAPALSMYDEWIDPRTQGEPHRVLTPVDLAPPPVQTPAQEAKEQETEPPPTPDQATTTQREPPPTNQEATSPSSAPTQTAASSSIKKRRHKKTSPSSSSDTTSPPAQMTIESVLVSSPDQTPASTEPEQQKQQQTDRSHAAPSSRNTHPDDIDWDTVVE